ncbi:MAG TPA: hypothetical protein VKV37_14100 [Ktedonobacteraceae bacterium]|nr:hypothetical protein [Ktedonobacteraceae bacterium]
MPPDLSASPFSPGGNTTVAEGDLPPQLSFPSPSFPYGSPPAQSGFSRGNIVETPFSAPTEHIPPPSLLPNTENITGAAPSGYGLPGYAPQQSYFPEAAPYYAPPPAPYYEAPSSQPPYPQQWDRQPRVTRSKKMLALLAALLLIPMIGGFGLLYYVQVARPAQLHAQATATVATANAHATGTAQAYASATASANATATAQVVATATAHQAIFNQATSKTPALTSAMTGQDGAEWDVYRAQGGGGCTFTGGALHASVFQQQFYVPCFAQATNFSNFAFQVQMTIVKGDEGGLIFRANDAASKFYLFRIGRDGYYSLNISKDNDHNTPIAFDSTQAIKTGLGQPNLLTVVAQGKNIYLYINKQFVGSAVDSTYAGGKIGVFAADHTAVTDVAFTNVRVWTL